MTESSPLQDFPAIVLAGGLGTRIRAVIGETPKPLAPILGRPALEWLIRFLQRQGVRRVIVSSGYKGDAIDRFAASRPVPGVEIACHREPEPLGTGGGFAFAARASRLSPEGWLVLNGDSFALAPLEPMVKAFRSADCKGVIAGLELEDASRYGRMIEGPHGRLAAFVEKQPGAGVINAGIYLLKPDVLDSIPENRAVSLEREVFPALTRTQAGLIISRFNAPFLDIGTPETLAAADAFIRRHEEHFTAVT